MKIVSTGEMQAIDRETAATFGIPTLVLMENAGRSMADWVRAHFGRERSLLAVCGSGNNGGDGLVLARHLHCRGCRVRVAFVPGQNPPTPETAANLAAAEKFGVPVFTIPDEAAFAALPVAADGIIIDALLGTGVTGPVGGLKAALITRINTAEKTVISLDVPSGFRCGYGIVQTGTVNAAFTLTVALLKSGMDEQLAQPPLGTVSILAAGFPPPLLDSPALQDVWVDTGLARTLLPARPLAAHKKTMGSVLVAAGSRRFPGAAVLAAQGCAAGGAGLVRLALPSGVTPLLPPWVIPLQPAADDGFFSAASAPFIQEELAAADAFLLGPGLGREPGTTALVELLLRDTAVPTVIDADGLYHLGAILGKHPQWHPAGPVVLTPHPGELRRLLKLSPDTEISENSVAALAARTGTVVVAKDRITRIFTPGGTVFRVASGHPALARGGTGDILAGLLCALLGRGMEAEAAACLGVFLHGAAGTVLAGEKGEDGLLPGMVADTIPRLREMLLDAPDGAPSLLRPSLLWPVPEVSRVG